jgi:hypothetical protein
VNVLNQTHTRWLKILNKYFARSKIALLTWKLANVELDKIVN